MKKLQEDLKKLFFQYEYVKKAMQFDLLLLAVYPIYRILCFCPFEFIYSLYKFATLFLLMFVIGVIFSFANNKLKESLLAVGVLTIISIVDVFIGNFDGIVYAVVYGFITYKLYKFMNISENFIMQNPNPMQNSNRCPACGNTISPEQAFCTICGKKLN